MAKEVTIKNFASAETLRREILKYRLSKCNTKRPYQQEQNKQSSQYLHQNYQINIIASIESQIAALIQTNQNSSDETKLAPTEGEKCADSFCFKTAKTCENSKLLTGIKKEHIIKSLSLKVSSKRIFWKMKQVELNFFLSFPGKTQCYLNLQEA